jgi:hypothetical protein
MIRTQISFDETLYKRAKGAAKEQGVSLAELCRRGVAEAVSRTDTKLPWMRLVGMVDGAPDDSSSVDEIVYGRERP